ncbi:hypothetical protein FIBSPDRAFT_918746 [Athelia psychrophila]|uniref:MYND-type domain-containing protein n=1 Tax=Athelia psychrophila TaxID=1759441 RepID=A0A166N2Q3_9AGAM|nr:hypothetical protein FIBSPDRAFT_918746 [Fibularhizoctonia sp. CBS 109695]
MSIYGPFAQFYMSARKMEAAERSGKPEDLRKLDFSLAPQCIKCNKLCIDSSTGQFKTMCCRGCLAIVYCGRTCQRADWKTPGVPSVPFHKNMCSKNKEYMKRLPHFRAVLEQFSWSRVEKDGTFPLGLIKARLGVLGAGGAQFGYWSGPGGQQSHDSSAYEISKPSGPEFSMRSKEYMHGDIMLGKEWPSHVKMWKIDEKHIPRIVFTDEHPCPRKVAAGDIKDWSGWYEWRGLTLDSPAALLMDVPLSVYHLLVNVLRVVRTDSTPEYRQSLKVHYIGAEYEINLLPLFSELALLLPNTDIELLIFGKPAHDLAHKARKSHPGSIASNDIVWSYTAPLECGGGSINIRLYSKAENWTRSALGATKLEHVPDAMVGLNAGILNYRSWRDPILMSAFESIPFAVTEYAEESSDQTTETARSMSEKFLEAFGPGSQYYRDIPAPREHPVTVNPFHRPGQRGLPIVRMPNVYNGFVVPLVTRG